MVSLTQATLIHIGGAFNTRPVGVAGAGNTGRSAERSIEEVDRDLATAAGADPRVAVAVLVGGEPTIRQDLGRLLSAVRRHGLVPGLVTNGRMLVYPEARARLLDGGVGYFRVELHGPDAATHDPLVRVAGAFEQTSAGLRALLVEAPMRTTVDVACTVVPANLDQLAALVHLVTEWKRQALLTIRFVAPASGSAEEGRNRSTRDLDDWPPAARVGAAVGAALDVAAAAGADVRAAWEGVAPCLLPGHAHLRDERLRRSATAFGSVLSAIPRENAADRQHVDACETCLQRPGCPGAPVSLLRRDGESALQPQGTVGPSPIGEAHGRRVDADGHRELRWLRKELSRLRGRVLDIGCAEHCFTETIAARLAAGEVEVLGLNPDAATRARLGAAAAFEVCAIEHLRCAAGRFDYVLGLGCLDSVVDLEKAFTIATRALRLQGQMVLCGPLPHARADGVTAGRLRSWTSAQWVDFLARFPLSVNVHRPPTGPHSLWIIKLLRTADV